MPDLPLQVPEGAVEAAGDALAAVPRNKRGDYDFEARAALEATLPLLEAQILEGLKARAENSPELTDYEKRCVLPVLFKEFGASLRGEGQCDG